MANWSVPYQKDEDGNTRELAKRVVVTGGMVKEAWLTPEEDAKIATTGIEHLPTVGDEV